MVCGGRNRCKVDTQGRGGGRGGGCSAAHLLNVDVDVEVVVAQERHGVCGGAHGEDDLRREVLDLEQEEDDEGVEGDAEDVHHGAGGGGGKEHRWMLSKQPERRCLCVSTDSTCGCPRGFSPT